MASRLRSASGQCLAHGAHWCTRAGGQGAEREGLGDHSQVSRLGKWYKRKGKAKETCSHFSESQLRSKSETTSPDRVDWSIKLFYRPLQERLWGRGEPWEDPASRFTSGRADSPVRRALVTLFPPGSQAGSLERHTRTLWGKRDLCGGVSSAASKASQVSGSCQEGRHQSRRPQECLVCARALCLFWGCAHPIHP